MTRYGPDFLGTMKARPLDCRRQKESFSRACEMLPLRLDSVLELFGGVGAFHGLLHERGHIDEQTSCELWEIDESCVAHLRSLCPNALVRQCDSFAQKIPDGRSLVVADFNSWTVLQYYCNLDISRLTRALFESKAAWVYLTDTSVRFLHLNRRAYQTLMGCPISDLASYCRGVDAYIAKARGFSLRRVVYHAHAAGLLFSSHATVRNDDEVSMVRIR